MNNRENFKRIFSFEKPQRNPIYFFGSWIETKQRWQQEGFAGPVDWVQAGGNIGPQLPGMDLDWENNLWDAHGLVNIYPIGDQQPRILSEDENAVVTCDAIGMVKRSLKGSNCIDHTIEFPLKPTRDSWESFKRFLNPADSRRYPADLTDRCQTLAAQQELLGTIGGSLYGYLRDWMGVEELSYLMYDDPELLSEMVGYLVDYMITLYQPVLAQLSFDFVYIFEDCCGATGPLFSPEKFDEIYADHYRRLIAFYKSHGVGFVLLDSDGFVEPLVPKWQAVGVDILFPVEVGRWRANPSDLRTKFGSKLCMMGGVDKHLIAEGGPQLRAHLESLRPAVEAGGYLPMPDHRIAPDCSYQRMLEYIALFDEIFNQQG